MTRVTASAPGKLFITGEYAVLERAPALLTAVDVRAHCRIEAAGGDCRIVALPLSPVPAVFGLDAEGLPRWRDEPVPLVDAAWRALEPSRRRSLADAGWHIVLDTSAFFLKDRKLGLGSSAAALAALMGALWKLSGGLPSEAEAFAALTAAHRTWQGAGSGGDLAASLAGGTLLFRREPCVAAPVALPAVEIVPVWSGEPASTGGFLGRLEEFRNSAPALYRDRLAVLARGAEEAAQAAASGDPAAFLEAFGDYGAALRALGDAAELPIWSAVHERIGAVVRAAGGVYKPSGAGGGDVGLALLSAGDAGRLAAVKSALSSNGYVVLPLRFAACGLNLAGT